MELAGKDIYGVGLDTSIRKIQLDFRQYVAQSKGGLNLQRLREIFLQYDQNQNGQLEIDEFEKCLTAFGMFLKKYEYQMIFKYYDSDQSGSLDFNEFLDGIRMPLNDRRLLMVRKVFNTLDRDNSGIITIEDIQNRVSFKNNIEVQNGKKSEEQLLEEFIRQFEQNQKDGKVSMQEFVNYYQDLSMSIPNDNYFVALLEETWLLTENDNELIAKQASQQVVLDLYNHLVRLSAGNKDDVLLRKLFNHYDVNSDGYIGLDEFQGMVKKLDIPHNTKYLSLAFSKIDLNRSGFIEFDEFFTFVVHGLKQ